MPILILPNKLNHAGQWEGAGVAGTYVGGRRGWGLAVVNLAE